MIRLESLFIEFGVSNKRDLISVISNKIDWFNEKLMDDCWDTVAKVYRDNYEKLLSELISNGSDFDIDLPQKRGITRDIMRSETLVFLKIKIKINL